MDLSLIFSNVRCVYGLVCIFIVFRMVEFFCVRLVDVIFDGVLRDYFFGGRVWLLVGVGVGMMDRSMVLVGIMGVGVGIVVDDF